jgi:F-box and WD-40 domain protein MET30
LNWVNQVRLELASRTLLSVSDDCTIKLRDLHSQTCMKTYEGHAGEAQQVLLLLNDIKFDDEHVREVDVISMPSQRSDIPNVGLSSSHLAPRHDGDQAAYDPIFMNDPKNPLRPRYFITVSLDLTMRLWESASVQSPRCFWGHVEGL